MKKYGKILGRSIVLIEARSPGEHIFSMIFLPRLGVPLLGTILRKAGYNVVEMIENFYPLDWNIIANADAVVISTITCTALGAYDIAKKCRDLGKITIMGGSHATFLPEEATLHADYVCLFESEKSLLALMNALLLDEGDPLKIAGIAYRDVNGLMVQNKSEKIILNLDELPFPDYSLIYGHPKMSITPIITSRGCPFHCDFCSVIQMFPEMNYRSIENVIEEIKYQNPSHIFFYDDNFAVKKSRTKEILEKMLELPKCPTWSAQVRVDIAKDKELMDLIKKSGCEYLYIGLESINPKTLESYQKKLTVEEIKECIEIFRKYKINAHQMFVLGSEYDTKETLRLTYDFALKSGAATVQFLNLTPLPGTPLWEREKNNFLTRDWSLFDANHVVMRSKNITPYELQKETVKIMEKFYSLWRVISGLFTHGLLVAKLRYVGRLTLRKWIGDNLRYFEFLKSLK